MKVIEMNEWFGIRLIRLMLIAAVAIVSVAGSLRAQTNNFNELPNYQRAPTPTGNWRVRQLVRCRRSAQNDPQDFQGEPRDQRSAEPVRYETINRVRPAYQRTNRPLPPADRDMVGNNGYEERLDRGAAARPARFPSSIADPRKMPRASPAMTAAHDCPIVTHHRATR